MGILMSYAETISDAGLLREHIARRYFRDYYFHGLTLRRYSLMLALIKRLARLARLTIDEAFAELAEDAEWLAEQEVLAAGN
jgi:hypothetical protein